jgi:hypothetical protein
MITAAIIFWGAKSETFNYIMKHFSARRGDSRNNYLIPAAGKAAG